MGQAIGADGRVKKLKILYVKRLPKWIPYEKAAYHPASNTIFVRKDLATSEWTRVPILLHELGHWLIYRLLGDSITHKVWDSIYDQCDELVREVNKWRGRMLFDRVISDLGHRGWTLEWYNKDSSEGFCWLERKVINVGPKAKSIKRLILHEIAHIDTCIGKRNKHGGEFWTRYEYLMDRYMPDVPLSESDMYSKELNADYNH